MKRTHRNQLLLLFLTASSYLSITHAQTGCVPTDICLTSSEGYSYRFECDDDNGIAIQTRYTDDSCTEAYPFGLGNEPTDYSCSSSTPCTEFVYLRFYEDPSSSFPDTTYDGMDNTWSFPTGTAEGSCGYFVGATTRAYDIDFYEFTVPEDTNTITIDSCGSDYDTYLYFLTADGTVIEECDDCGDCGVQTILTVYGIEPGQYQIGVGGYSSDFGSYGIHVYCDYDMSLPQSTNNQPFNTDPYPTSEGAYNTMNTWWPSFPQSTNDRPDNTWFIPTWSYQTTDYPSNTDDTDTDWFFYPTIDGTYPLDEDVCDSTYYREMILPTGCEYLGDGKSRYLVCSLEGFTFYFYDSVDCSGDLIQEINYLEGCNVGPDGETLKWDLLQCLGVDDVDTTTTTEEGIATDEPIEPTDDDAEDGDDMVDLSTTDVQDEPTALTEETEEPVGTDDVCNDGRIRFSKFEEIGNDNVAYCYDGLDDDGYAKYVGGASMYYSNNIEAAEGASGYVIFYENQVVAYCVEERNPTKCGKQWMVLNVNDVFVQDQNMVTFNCDCDETVDGVCGIGWMLGIVMVGVIMLFE